MAQRTVKSTPIDSPSFDWNGAAPVALRIERPVDLIARRVAAHLVDAGQYQHRTGGVTLRRAVEEIGAHHNLPALHARQRRVAVERVAAGHEEPEHHELEASASHACAELAPRAGGSRRQPGAELAQPASHALKKHAKPIPHVPTPASCAVWAKSDGRAWQRRGAKMTSYGIADGL